MPEILRGAFPLLVRVTTCDDVVPTFWAPKLKLGVRTAIGAIPVPVSGRLSGDELLLLETLSAPLAGPIAAGVKVTLMGQFAPAASVAGHVLL